MKVPKLLLIPLGILTGVPLSAQDQDLAVAEANLPMIVDHSENILQTTSNKENLSMLTAAVYNAELEEILDKPGPFTVFAPSNDAFAKMTDEELHEMFTSEDKTKLRSLLAYHIVVGRLTASKILKAMCRGMGEAKFKTVQGKTFTATIDGIDIVLVDEFGNSAKITQADLDRSNGVVHTIDGVIVPRGI